MNQTQQQMKNELSTLARNMGKSIQAWTTDNCGTPVAILDDGSLFQPLHANSLTRHQEQYQHVQAYFQQGFGLHSGF